MSSSSPTSKIIVLAIAVAAFAFTARLLVLGDDVWFQGDSHLYAVVAENILRHGCVSLSPPQGGLCLPHWGGNQLPAYPFFMAVVWWFTGPSHGAIALTQSFLFATAAGYLAWQIRAAGLSVLTALAIGLIVGLSPSALGFARAVLTEELAAAAALWLLAALVRSHRQGRLCVWEVGLSCLVGFFLRYDFALFAVPVAVAGLMLHAWPAALMRGLAIALIVALPSAAWTARNAVAGLSPLPPFGLTPDGRELPQGALAWMGTWVKDQYQLSNTVWPLVTQDYSAISIPTAVLQQSLIGGEIEQLRGLSPASRISPDLDRLFAAEASRIVREQPFEQFLFLPLRRLAGMWFNPRNGMLIPPDIDSAQRTAINALIAQRDFAALLSEHALALSVRAYANAWRLGAAALCLLALPLLWRRRHTVAGFVALLALTAVATRSLVFSQTLLVETRYLTTGLVWLDAAVLCAALVLWSAWRRRDLPAGGAG